MLPNELDLAMSSAAPFLKNLREGRMARQDRCGFVRWRGAELVARRQALHTLVECCLNNSVTIRHLDHLVEVPGS